MQKNNLYLQGLKYLAASFVDISYAQTASHLHCEFSEKKDINPN